MPSTRAGETLAEAMTRVKADVDLRQWCAAHLMRGQDRDKYVCPFCGSGDGGGRHTAALHAYQDHFRCFSCGTHGDVFDLAGKYHGTDDRAGQLEAVVQWAGVQGWDRDDRPPHDRSRDKAASDAQGGRGAADPEHDDAHEAARQRERDYIAEAQRRIDDPRAVCYLSSRGISLEEARAWGLGFDPSAGGAKRADGTWCDRGRIVIPWAGSDYYHVDRSIAPDVASAKYTKPRAEDVGPQPLYNPEGIKEAAFFVVEGVLDALAVKACGYEAVALAGTGGHEALIKAIAETEGHGAPFLLLDLDDAGRRAEAELSAKMEGAGIVAFCRDEGDATTMAGAGKDPDEMRRADPAWFAEWLRVARDFAAGHANAAREEVYRKRLRTLNVEGTTGATEQLFTLEGVRDPIPTGLRTVDEALGGGLPARGLVVLGAASSVGKTSFVVQLADFTARNRRPVLFVTIEMGRQELAAKSISRIMASCARENGAPILASSQAIMNPRTRAAWEASDPEKLTALLKACDTYSAWTHTEDGAPLLYLMEPEEAAPKVSEIRDAAEEIARYHGTPPLVIVDYLQLLSPAEGYERATDKQAVDRNVTGLRIMARTLDTCVIAISSINRAAYTQALDLDSFKESGSVEFSSDLLLGLQPAGLAEALRQKGEDKRRQEAREAMRRFKEAAKKDVELVVLKHRCGRIPADSPRLTFDGLTSSYYEPAGGHKARGVKRL